MTVLISGLINIETTLAIDAFPIPYQAVRYPFFGVKTTVSGVGYNLAKALTTLGEPVDLMSLVGDDVNAAIILQTLQHSHIRPEGVLMRLSQTPQSVILYDSSGTRMINTDLKNVQEVAYPRAMFMPKLYTADVAILCNINFSREYLTEARQLGTLIVTDVHAIRDLDDPYNRDFMANADILFMSDAQLPTTPEAWANAVLQRFTNVQMVVIGLGSQGALIAVRHDQRIERVPAVVTRPIVNTIGAGDAMLASFVYGYRHHHNPYRALRHAMVFASWKCGASGGAEGFLTATEFERLTMDLP